MRLLFAAAISALLTCSALAGEKEDEAYRVGKDAPHMLWAAANCGTPLTKTGEVLIGGAKKFYPAHFDRGFEEGKPWLTSVVKRMGKADACDLYKMYFGPDGMVWKGALQTR